MRVAVLLLCASTSAVGQSVVSARAVRQADSTTTLRVGARVTVIGRVTLGPGVLDTSEVNVHVQDSTGGVFLDTKLTPAWRAIAQGDSVAVTGTIAHGTGRNRLMGATARKLGAHRRQIVPERILALEADRLAPMVGRLVRIEGQVLRGQFGRTDQTLFVTDTALNAVDVRVLNDAAGNVLLRLGRFSPGDRLRITGVLDQRITGSTGAIRYTVYPRSEADLDAVGLTARMRQAILRASLIALPLLIIIGAGALTLRRRVTKGRREHAVLRDSAERYRQLIDQAPVAIVVHRAGLVRLTNTAFAALVGSHDPVVLQSTFAQVLDSAGRSGPPGADSKRSSRAMVPVRRIDGGATETEITETLVTYEGVECTQTVLYDVSERVRAERALAASEIQLRQAQKLEAVGLLAGGIAHDFNNILTTIQGNAQFLADGCTQCGEMPPEAREINAATDRAAALTRQLLAFSRKQVVQPRVLELDQLVRSMSLLLQRLLPENVQQCFDLAAPQALVRVDASHIEQVILNLAVNARDAMPSGGTLEIGTSVETFLSEAEAVIHHPELTIGDYAILTVRDTGVGMSDEVREQIFDPFFTTKEPGKGTGLGLATVYGIVKQHAGCIRVLSQPDRGTTFRIYLPQAVAASEVVAAAPPLGETLPSISETSGGGTILIVEDEPAIRRIAERTLSKEGYSVLVADDGPAAIACAHRHGGPIHLLLTDVVLPGMSGREVADQLRRMLPAIRVLFMSGYAQDHMSSNGELEPGVALLEKPFTPAQLRDRVRQALAGEPAAFV